MGYTAQGLVSLRQGDFFFENEFVCYQESCWICHTRRIAVRRASNSPTVRCIEASIGIILYTLRAFLIAQSYRESRAFIAGLVCTRDAILVLL